MLVAQNDDLALYYLTVIVGEIANFVAYIYAPAVLVTPLGALSIIVRWTWFLISLLSTSHNTTVFKQVYLMNYELCLQTGSAVLAHFMLNEKLQKMGMLGCLLCVVGSTMIVLHAPLEESLNSVQEIWVLATQPGMLLILLFILVIERSLFWFLPSSFFFSDFLRWFCLQHFFCMWAQW